MLSLDRDVFFEIEFCGFVTKLMTVGHVVWFLGRLNPAEPMCEEPSLMIHRGRVLVWLWLDPGVQTCMARTGNLSAEATGKAQPKSLQAWAQHGPALGPGPLGCLGFYGLLMPCDT